MSTNHPSTYKDDNINVKLERLPDCKISLEVAVTPEATQASHHKAMANIRKEVSIPGFRKGKAPEAMIRKNYGTHIEREWKDILLNSTLDEAIRLIKIYPFNKNSVKSASIKSVSLENGSVLTFEYESGPEVPSIMSDNLSIAKVPLKEVKEKDIDKTLEDLRIQSGEWKDVEGRAAQEGDYVIIDIDDIGESGHNICRETLFEVSKGKMADWMMSHVIGMSPGDIAEGMTEKERHDPECQSCEDGTHSHHDHDDKFVPVNFRLMLHNIREVTPHPLDDALAKKYGADNAEQLKERVKASLEKRAHDEQKDSQRMLMEKELFDKYPFDVPGSIVQSEVQAAKAALIKNLKEQGLPKSKIDEQVRHFETQATQKYKRDFCLYFLTQKIAHENNLQVDNNEVMSELMRQMWMSKSGQTNIDMSMDPAEIQTLIRMRLMAAKALDFFVDKLNKA